MKELVKDLFEEAGLDRPEEVGISWDGRASMLLFPFLEFPEGWNYNYFDDMPEGEEVLELYNSPSGRLLLIEFNVLGQGDTCIEVEEEVWEDLLTVFRGDTGIKEIMAANDWLEDAGGKLRRAREEQEEALEKYRKVVQQSRNHIREVEEGVVPYNPWTAD